MNERIQELAEQAGMIIVDDEFSTYGKFAEKLAELIVQECIETLRLVPYNSDREFGDEVIYQDAVKQHFGVEE